MSRPGKRDAVAVLVDDIVESKQAGAFHWTSLYAVDDDGPYGMNFRCPCGCGALHGARFDNRPAAYMAKLSEAERRRPQWTWNGDKEKPTLSPSLGLHPTPNFNRVGPDGKYHWHGFLRAGVFEEC